MLSNLNNQIERPNYDDLEEALKPKVFKNPLQQQSLVQLVTTRTTTMQNLAWSTYGISHSHTEKVILTPNLLEGEVRNHSIKVSKGIVISNMNSKTKRPSLFEDALKPTLIESPLPQSMIKLVTIGTTIV